MGRHSKTDPSTRPSQVVVGPEAHQYLRLRAALENVTLQAVIEDLVRAEKARFPILREDCPQT